MHYAAPGGDRLEAQADNFDSSEEATAPVESMSFCQNPAGVDFDPESNYGKADIIDVQLTGQPTRQPRAWPIALAGYSE